MTIKFILRLYAGLLGLVGRNQCIQCYRIEDRKASRLNNKINTPDDCR